MSLPDRAVEKGADGLEGLGARTADRGAVGERPSPALQEDADFVRKMTPSKVKDRLRTAAPAPEGRTPRRDGPTSGIQALLAAFALGVVAAKLVTWRSYAE